MFSFVDIKLYALHNVGNEWACYDCLWQLFEMGLELSLARLKALAKFAFGMGLTQVWC